MQAPQPNRPVALEGVSSTPQAAIQPEQARPSVRRRPFLLGLAAVALLAVGSYGWHWWTVGRFLETTDDAFLQADKVTVAPRIAGYVAEVLVGDDQPVKAGDVIARLDDREYRVALKQAEAEIERDKAQMLGVAAAIRQQQAQIEQARAEVANTQAAATFAGQEQARYRDLLQSGNGTVQRQQQAESDLRQRRASDDKARASLDAAEKQVDSLRAVEAGARASLAGAEAKLEQASLNLTYATIVAPIDGVVGDRSLRAGQYVTAGTNLLTLVAMGRGIYLLAHFKETQVGAMAEGQPVQIKVDALSGHEFRGTVASFAPGTGAQFALLPPENATGNFTKVVQRVSVRIALDGDDPLLPRLRPGLSVEATVHTGDTAVKTAAAQVSQAQSK